MTPSSIARPALPTRRPRSRLLALLAAACGLLLAAPAAALAQGAGNDKSVCAYTNHSLAGLHAFGAMVHRDINCAMVYNNSAPDWANWENPWFLRNTGADSDFKDWATARGTNRRVIITQDLFPRALDNTAWRAPGAAGAYTAHAAALARNLVAAGLGNATIRLAHEANGTWYPHNIGTTAQDFAQWVQFWRKTAIAMRSVPGAHFQFDWCINAQDRPIPLSQFYPGDDVVDIVGIDAYDIGSSAPAGTARWNTINGRTEGIADVVAFARAHGKPMSIPEWGVSPTSNQQGGGDDPAYVDGIADVVRSNRVSYQSYFYKYGWATQLAGGPASLASYVRHFSATGDSGPGSVARADSTDSSGSSSRAISSGRSASLRLTALAKATARGAMSALVRRGTIHRPGGSVLVRSRSASGGTVCVLASVAPARARSTAAALAARTRSHCATRKWVAGAAGRSVLASGRASLSSAQSTPLALRYSSRSLRRMGSHGHVRLTVVAVIVPTGGRAKTGLQRRSVYAR